LVSWHVFDSTSFMLLTRLYWGCCDSRLMSYSRFDRITGHPEVDSKIKNDPIELLKAIEILINDPVRARYPYASMTKSITRFMTCRQQENESLTDYVKRFKSNQDGLARTMGKDFLKKFTENTREYQEETDVNKQNATAYPRWTAYMLMKNSDQGKYGSLMTGPLTTQYSMGVNMYLENVVKAIDILTDHRFDKKEPKNNNNNQRSKNRNDDDTALTIQHQRLLLRVVLIKKKRRTHNATAVARKDTIQTNVLKKVKDPRTNGQ
jgi:hypothetical protein